MIQKVKYRDGVNDPWTIASVWIPDNIQEEDIGMFVEMNMGSMGITYNYIKFLEPTPSWKAVLAKYTVDSTVFWLVAEALLGILVISL